MRVYLLIVELLHSEDKVDLLVVEVQSERLKIYIKVRQLDLSLEGMEQVHNRIFGLLFDLDVDAALVECGQRHQAAISLEECLLDDILSKYPQLFRLLFKLRIYTLVAVGNQDNYEFRSEFLPEIDCFLGRSLLIDGGLLGPLVILIYVCIDDPHDEAVHCGLEVSPRFVVHRHSHSQLYLCIFLRT